MPISPAKRKANDAYDKAHMTTFSVKLQNNLHGVLQQAIASQNTNRNAYVVQAIREKLSRDGFLNEENKRQ